MSDNLMVDEKAFNDTFNENKLYKPDIDHHWLSASERVFKPMAIAARRRSPTLER